MTTVTIGCKTPNGFIMEVNGVTQKINGWNSNQIFQLTPSEKVGLTEDVKEDFYKSWLEKHKSHPLVTNGIVFAQKSTNSAKAEAKEKQGVKTGMEAIDQDAKSGGVEKETK